jgi:acetyl esterase/lipase
MLARIADATGMRTVAIDYRKAPEHPFPAALEDALAAYRALLSEGCDARRIAMGGDSAGGGLTLAVLQRLREAGDPLPAAAVLLSPWVDLRASEGSMVDNDGYDYLAPKNVDQVAQVYAGGRDRGDPLISPLHAELAGMPPMLVLSGGAEIFLTQNAQLVHRARAAGVDVEHDVEDGMIHVYPMFADIEPRGRRAIERIGAFLRGALGDAG